MKSSKGNAFVIMKPEFEFIIQFLAGWHFHWVVYSVPYFKSKFMAIYDENLCKGQDDKGQFQPILTKKREKIALSKVCSNEDYC